MFNTITRISMKIISVIISLLVFSVMLITISAVFARYILNKPIPWYEEISMMLFAWYVFLGAGLAIRKDTVVSVDLVYEKFSPTLKKISSFFTSILSIGIYVMIIYLGYQLAIRMYQSVTPYLNISFRYIYISIPIGGIFVIMGIIANFKDVLMEGKKLRNSNIKNKTI